MTQINLCLVGHDSPFAFVPGNPATTTYADIRAYVDDILNEALRHAVHSSTSPTFRFMSQGVPVAPAQETMPVDQATVHLENTTTGPRQRSVSMRHAAHPTATPATSTIDDVHIHLPSSKERALMERLVAIDDERHFFEDEDALQSRIASQSVRLVVMGGGIGVQRYDAVEDVPDHLNHAYAVGPDQPPVWISIEGAVNEDKDGVLARMGRRFRLHPLTVEDCATLTGREKLEVFHDHLFVSFHALAKAGLATTAPVRVLVFRNAVVTVHAKQIPAVAEARRRLLDVQRFQSAPDVRANSTSLVPNVGFVLHALLDCIMDGMIPLVEGTCRQVDTLEDLVYVLTGFEHRDLLKRMSGTRRRIAVLKRGLHAKRDILATLVGKDWHRFVSSVPLVYLRDVSDHVESGIMQLEAAAALLVALQSTYHSKVSIEVAAAANKTSENINRISVGGAILLPLTFLAALFGMNVAVPWQTGEDPTAGDLVPFVAISVFSVLFAVGMYGTFRARGYL